jgi:hypothetical protein
MLSKHYPLPFVLGVIDTIYKKYPRATEVIQEMYGINRTKLATIFNQDQNRWEKYRKTVKTVDSLLRYENYYTDVKVFYTYINNVLHNRGNSYLTGHKIKA